MKILNNKKYKKGYSLIEIIISLSIMGFAITVMFSFLILSLRVSVLSLSRSFVREELAGITNLIARDIRNSDFVNNCGSTVSSNSCELVQSGTRYQWAKCDSNGIINNNSELNTRVCKFRIDSGNQRVVLFISSASVVIKNFDFSLGFTSGTSNSQTNILVLVNASHSNSSYNINNVIRQISVSTRNF